MAPFSLPGGLKSHGEKKGLLWLLLGQGTLWHGSNPTGSTRHRSTGVGTLVTQEVGLTAKTPGTVSADIRAQASVDGLVPHQVGLRTKATWTLGAGVGAQPRVHGFVPGQV